MKQEFEGFDFTNFWDDNYYARKEYISDAPTDILYHLFGHFQRRLQMNNPLLLVYHVFDKTHELHAVAEAMFELSVVKQLYQSLIERVFEYAPDESVVHL